MKKLSALSVTIPHPCTASWANMAAASSGKFCNSCHKSVIDFAALTDEEIVRIFSQSSGKVCGRFNASQLNRIIDTSSGKHIALPAAMLTALLMTSGMAISAAPVSPVVTLSPFVAPTLVKDMDNDTTSNPIRVISGKVSDNTTGDLLPAVVVAIKGTKRATVTDARGQFHLEVPDSLYHQSFIVQCSFVGYERMERKVNADERGSIDLVLQMNTVILGEIAIVCVRKATLKERLVAKWRALMK